MIYPVTYYGAKCDNCGKEWADANEGYAAYNCENYLSDCLDEEGWHFGGGEDNKHYCPDCHEVGDNDEIVIKSKKL
ncbi:MAG TPA: hypothetical protein VD907_06750 [Verrucomicrobiae bacterium]|nr:hypothetical protein [Verrucomicrobiae bacterium]